MKLFPGLTLILLLALGGLTACGDDTENANDGAATSASDEPEAEQETEDAPPESETTEPSEPTNPDVIAYCEVVATMAKLQKAGKDFVPESEKLGDLTPRISQASSDGDLTAADKEALIECNLQLDEVYRGS